MKKAEKSKIGNWPEPLRGLFQKTSWNPNHTKENSRWKTKSIETTFVQENLTAEPTSGFQDPTSNRVDPTPPQNTPTSKTPVKNTSPVAPTYVLPANQPPLVKLSSAKPATSRKPFFQLEKTLPAFWTVTSTLSLIINIVLIVALVLVGRELFTLKAMLGDKLLGGLYENFIFMDQAHIKTSISVVDNIAINFTLPISQDTMVTLTENTPISGANVRINTGGMTINSPANIILPAGTTLPIHLELSVPVTTTVPINIKVPVDIPLEKTELHKPFIGLQGVVAPFYNLMQPNVKGPQDTMFCKPYSAFCSFYFQQ